MKTRLSTRSRIWPDLAALLLLCVSGLLLYRQVALTNQILSGADAMNYFYPYRAYAAHSIRSGQVPLWNPYLFLGVPFLANPQTAVFYPPNLALNALSAPKQVAWSLVLHATLAALSAYLYARRVLKLSPATACLAAAAFGQGGYLAAQAEHVNQVNVLSWFPLLLFLWETRTRRRWLSLLGLAVVIGLGLLAGHTQASYISLVGLVLYALVRALLAGAVAARSPERRNAQRSLLGSLVQSAFDALWQLALSILLAFCLAAVQILPTLELSRRSIRSGGLSYRQAVAFSLRPAPRLLRYTFLPVLGQARALSELFGGGYYTEFLAYVGWVALVLALVVCVRWVWVVVRERWDAHRVINQWLHEYKHVTTLLLLGGAGLFFALGLYNPLYWLFYKLVPGFGLFRAPARWLFLYAFAVPMLAGVGLQYVQDRLRAAPVAARAALSRPLRSARVLSALIVAVSIAELFLAARHLPLNHLTAPESFFSLRSAPSHILAAQAQDVAPSRFLSMSDTLFDPGDLREIEQLYQGQLAPSALYDYVVSLKRQEILAPNLPLAWRIYAVDGYDGGVLPLARYIRLQELLLAPGDILTDGRLREGLAAIPSSKMLSILGAKYVMTDKVHDVWIDGVFYDLAFETVLSADTDQLTTATAYSPTPVAATTLGIVSHLTGAHQVAQGAPIAQVIVTMRSQEQRTFVLRAGQDTAETDYTRAAHDQAQIGQRHQVSSDDSGAFTYDYVTQLSWDTPQEVFEVEIAILPFDGQLCVRGLALIDRRDQTSAPLLLTSRGRFAQVHSGDVKIYQALDLLPRAYAVHQALFLDDDTEAIARLSAPDFDPSQVVILHGDPQRSADSLSSDAPDSTPTQSDVAILSYQPHEIALQAHMERPGYIVLSDTWYPGWHASLDGQSIPIERANLAFRAVRVPQGSHTLTMSFRPASYLWGARFSLCTLAAMALAALFCAGRVLRHTPD